jgi:ElaB/YqjD/DUF883 family membrane-anchored ribosome-binding protein
MATTRKDEIEATAATEPLSAELAALRADLTELSAMVGRIGRQRAQGLRSAAGETAAEGYARGEEALDVALAELRSLEDELAEATRRRPFASLGIAALIGFLFGVLFRR